MDRARLGTTTPGQSRPGRDGNEGVFCIPQSPSITGISLSNFLVSYRGHLLEWGVLPLCKVAVGVFYRLSLLGNSLWGIIDPSKNS